MNKLEAERGNPWTRVLPAADGVRLPRGPPMLWLFHASFNCVQGTEHRRPDMEGWGRGIMSTWSLSLDLAHVP